MNKKTKKMLVGVGLSVGLTLLDSYVRKQTDKNNRDKIETLISEVRDEMGNYSRITHNPKSIELEANKVNLDGVVSDKYVTKAEFDETVYQINSLQSGLIDLEMSVQAEDDTYSMQDYHNDMKYIEDKLSKLSEPILLSIRDRAFGMLSTREFKELVDRVYTVEKTINKEDKE